MNWLRNTLFSIILLSVLFIGSCNPQEDPTHPQSTKINLININRSIEDLLEEEIKNCPIPLLITDKSTLDGYFSRHPNIEPKEYAGFFVKEVEDEEFPSPFIFIDKTIKNINLLSILYHELGHYSCYATGCTCSEESIVIMELHASRYEAKKCLESRNTDLIDNLMLETMAKIEIGKYKEDPHYIAANALTYEKEWGYILIHLYVHRYANIEKFNEEFEFETEFKFEDVIVPYVTDFNDLTGSF